MRGPRFEAQLTDEAAALNASIDFDRRLLPFDVKGSQAHARMLGAQGIISVADADAICAGLAQVLAEWERGELVLDAKLEDVHMNVEVRLKQLIGEPAGRLHTARSRNDQVATDLRLWTVDAARRIQERVAALRRALLEQAKVHMDTLLPGYTHLQRAQPTRLSHHLLAYDAMLARDAERFADAARRANRSPLGSGALTGTTFPIDREATARALGFDSITDNTLDAVSDRDFAVEIVAAAALCSAHLSRMGEELVLWAAQEFGFVRLPEGYCSGSSIMPQKVNPDIPELVRAKVGRVIGDWVTLMTVVKGLPLSYNKDLQETQEPLYDAVETVLSSLGVMAGCIAGCVFDVGRMREALGRGYVVATELADYLVVKGMPFRAAHSVTGALVRQASERGLELAQLSIEEMQAEASQHGSVAIGPDVFLVLDPERAVDRRDVPGGPARGRILEAIARVERELAG